MDAKETITVIEAISFVGCLRQLSIEAGSQFGDKQAMSARYAYAATADVINVAIAEQNPGVNYGALINVQRRKEDTITLDETVARAGAWACRSLIKTGEVEWPSVKRMLDQ